MSQAAGREGAAQRHGYEFFMLALCLFALLILAIEKAAPFEAGTHRMIQYADTTVCLLFLGDFVHSLLVARNRWRYLATWGWIDLLSSIPMVDAFRVGRLARILRVLRVLRGFKATRLLVEFTLTRRAESAVLAASLTTILVLFGAGASVLHFEDTHESNIKTPGDALWWSLATLTTVGYGDRFPVTVEGRLVGAVLMLIGVGLVGTLSGLAASWFLSPSTSRGHTDLELLRAEITELRKTVESLTRPPSDAHLPRRSTDPRCVERGEP